MFTTNCHLTAIPQIPNLKEKEKLHAKGNMMAVNNLKILNTVPKDFTRFSGHCNTFGIIETGIYMYMQWPRQDIGRFRNQEFLTYGPTATLEEQSNLI